MYPYFATFENHTGILIFHMSTKILKDHIFCFSIKKLLLLTKSLICFDIKNTLLAGKVCIYKKQAARSGTTCVTLSQTSCSRKSH